jgi:two-component system, OmpR family, response regulator ChvI
MLSSRIKINSSECCAVMFVDMVHSTKMACGIGDSAKLRTFYEMFINTLSEVAIGNEARIVKNGGDSIICYFPRTKDCAEKSAFRKILKCGLEMIHARENLNSGLESVGLPVTSYRISIDYGKHEVIKNQDLDIADMFGPTMSVCAKINSLAPPNSLIIGSDLYEIVRSFPDFKIVAYGEYAIYEKQSYPVFLVFPRT